MLLIILKRIFKWVFLVCVIAIFAGQIVGNFPSQFASPMVLTVPRTADSSSPVGYWPLNGNGASLASGSNATLVGGGLFSINGWVVWGLCIYRHSGSDLQIADNSAFELPQNFTIEFWFKKIH